MMDEKNLNCYYIENHGKEEGSLYEQLNTMIRKGDSDGITLIDRLTDRFSHDVAIYHILNATVVVQKVGRENPRHNFVARTHEQIEEAKSKLEESTGVELVRE